MLNKVMAIGNLGADPEMRYTANGTAVTNFSMATSRRWTDRDGAAHEETEWIRVVTWDKLAEVCAQYLTKGRQCYVEGRLQTRSWETPDGQTRYMTEVIAQEVKFLGGGNRAEGQQGGPGPPVARTRPDAAPSATPAAQGDYGGDIEPDDLPF